MQVCMEAKKAKMSTFFTPFPDTNSWHISLGNLASDVIAHANAHANVTLGVYHLLPDSTHTSWHASCIPEAYLVHRSEGGEVENLDISIYISTFLTIMYTMYTLYTFLEKVCMMKVRESKKIKKFCGTNFFFISRVSPTATDSSGVYRYTWYTWWQNG